MKDIIKEYCGYIVDSNKDIIVREDYVGILVDGFILDGRLSKEEEERKKKEEAARKAAEEKKRKEEEEKRKKLEEEAKRIEQVKIAEAKIKAMEAIRKQEEKYESILEKMVGDPGKVTE